MCINPEHLTCTFDLKMLSLTIWHQYFIRALGCQQSHPSVMLAECSITRCAGSLHFRHHCQRNTKPFQLSTNAFRKYQLKAFWMGQQTGQNIKNRGKKVIDLKNLIALRAVLPLPEEVSKHWKESLPTNSYHAKWYFPRDTYWRQ